MSRKNLQKHKTTTRVEEDKERFNLITIYKKKLMRNRAYTPIHREPPRRPTRITKQNHIEGKKRFIIFHKREREKRTVTPSFLPRIRRTSYGYRVIEVRTNY